MKLRACLLAALAVATCPSFASAAAGANIPGLRESERQHRCPVVTSEIVGLSSTSIRYRGIKIYLSSTAALVKWNRSPAAYADPRILPQLEGLTLPERPIEQVYCPVYRERKVSHHDPFVVHNGKKVYFYDELARRKWLVQTSRYLDLDLLPQLRPPEEADDDALDAELEGLIVKPGAEDESGPQDSGSP
jgi:hypothetical protein